MAAELEQMTAGTLRVSFVRHMDELEAAQRLRYRVFAEELGATLSTLKPGLDIDQYDPYCEHLVVKDEATDCVVGTYRVLLPEGAAKVGHYYSESEFGLEQVLSRQNRIMELGRSCVHKNYRKGAVISLLWTGLASTIRRFDIDFLMGCASVPDERGDAIGALYRQLSKKHLAPQELQVAPKKTVPLFDPHAQCPPATLPILLKGYLRVGAKIGGPPCWDPNFHAADFFMWLDARDVEQRYRRHFLSFEADDAQ